MVISVRSETHDFRSCLVLFVSELGDAKSMAYRRRGSRLASQNDSRFIVEVPGDGDISEDETETEAEGDAIADVVVTDSDTDCAFTACFQLGNAMTLHYLPCQMCLSAPAVIK